MLLSHILLALLPSLASASPHHHHGRRDSRHTPHSFASKRDEPSALPLASLSYNPSITDAAYLNLTHAIPHVLQNAIAISSHSWEVGTLTEALLEVYSAELTPFAFRPGALSDPFVVPRYAVNVTARQLANYDWSGAPSASVSSPSLGRRATPDFVSYLSTSTPPTPLKPQPLVDGAGSLGDPAALGTSVLLLAHFAHLFQEGTAAPTNPADSLRIVASGTNVANVANFAAVPGGPSPIQLASDDAYAWATANQLAYLRASPSDNGTISHREGHLELWSDMGYMIPPFLAFVGLSTGNNQLLSEALDQWSLESAGLLDPAVNLYRHVNSFDPRFWATGNGWMLCGLVRVLASIRAGGQYSALQAKASAAEETAGKVFSALFAQLDASNRLPNYLSTSDSQPGVRDGDSAGTAAVVAAFYRFLRLRPDLASPLTDKARSAFDGVVAKIDDSAWLTDVVDPSGNSGFLVRGDVKSPEGQSLLALMWAARTAAGV